MVVYFDDDIPWPKTSFGGRFSRRHVAYGRGGIGLRGRLANGPDNHRKYQGQQKAEKRSGESHNDFVQRTNRSQIFSGGPGFPFDAFHWGHLRQEDKASGRNPTETVLDPFDGFFPDWTSKPDPEFVHVQPPPASRQEMPQLMDDDEEVKN